MKLIKPRTFVIFAMLSLCGIALLHTSQSVRRAEKELAVLKSSIEREEDKIQMLGAEWVHLNRPERLEQLASEFLDLAAPKINHLVSEDDEVFAEDPEEREIKAQPVSLEPSKPLIKPPVKPQIRGKVSEEKSKDFGTLLDELGGQNGGAP